MIGRSCTVTMVSGWKPLKRVASALELFPSTFRHLDMKGLMDITYQLRDIFGWETELVESFGPHESLETGGSEEAARFTKTKAPV